MIVALFQLAPMSLTALDEASVLTMTYVNVRRSGLVKTVPSSLARLSIIVLVGILPYSSIAIFRKYIYI